MYFTKEILINDFDYHLPDEKIAKYPLKKRDKSKLLIYRKKRQIKHDLFENLSHYLPDGSLLVFNNTRVIHARLLFQKFTGALIEIFCLKPIEPIDYTMAFQSTNKCKWECIVGNLKRWKDDCLNREINIFGNEFELSARKVKKAGKYLEIEFLWNHPQVSFGEILEYAGEIPIPPYLKRKAVNLDKETYQTIYSKINGSVAAPTAGLHFTENVLNLVHNKGIQAIELTLHVGAGTFQPVKTKLVMGHIMHKEELFISIDAIEKLNRNFGNIISVGTTSLRTLESLYWLGVKLETGAFSMNDKLILNQWDCYEFASNLSVSNALTNLVNYLKSTKKYYLNASTELMIVPGYNFKMVKGIITNFHQPKSTLLLLISALVGDEWKEIYTYALENNFRFLSYGDSSLLIP